MSPLLAGPNAAQHQAARIQVEARPLNLAGGQLAEEGVKGDVGVRQHLVLPRDARQVVPPNLGEIVREVAVAQQMARVLPFILASLHEIVEGLAAPAGGENELMRQLSRRRRSGDALLEKSAIEIAERRIARVGTLTSRT